MLAVPDTDFDAEDPEMLLDWVELSALAKGELRLSDVQDEIARAVPNGRARGSRRTVSPADTDTEPDHRSSTVLFDSLRPTVLRRRREMKSGYPFTMDHSTISVKDSGWPSHVVYTSLMLADLGRRYSVFRQGTRFRILFERIVTGSLSARLMGTTLRFGSPREGPTVPGSIGKRIDWLSDKMGVTVIEENRVTKRSTGDEGLDVVGRLSFGDDLPGNLVLLVQCSTSGRLEQVKKGEPAIAKWQGFLNWNSLLVKAVATPFRLDPPRNRRAGDLCRALDWALVLDRPRLCHGRVDDRLDSGTLKELKRWCKSGLRSIQGAS